MIKAQVFCDECEKEIKVLNTFSFQSLQTSYFYRDGAPLGQSAQFCIDHEMDSNRARVKIVLPIGSMPEVVR